MPKKNSLKKITEANFSNLVSYLLYAYQKKSTEKLLVKSILWAKLDMRILQRLALNRQLCQISNDKESFNIAAPIYLKTLKEKNRKRDIIWYITPHLA